MAALKKENRPIKLLLIGESGSGKTGALCSLAAAGYNLRIIDIDKGSDILVNYLTSPSSPYLKQNPNVANHVDIVQVSDPMKSINGRLQPAKAVGWVKATKLLMDWSDGESNFGPVSSWGEKDVLVIDSLTGLSRLALNYHLSMNTALGAMRTQNEARRDIGNTQNYIRDLLELLYDDSIKCNVIVISHITAVSEAGGIPKIEDGQWQGIPSGFPSSIGRSLSPNIPKWFNNMLIATKTIVGQRAVQKIATTSRIINSQAIGAKSSAPLKVKDEYNLSSGLAEFFADINS